jgi:ATP-dependent helicase HepA
MWPLGALLRSTIDPESGPIRLVAADGARRGQVQYLWRGNKRLTVDIHDARLARLRLFSGMEVAVVENGNTRISTVRAAYDGDPETSLLAYDVEIEGTIRRITEDVLVPRPLSKATPLNLFKSLEWSSADAFKLRVAFARQLDDWYTASFGLPASLGARIMPLGHQYYAVRRVLSQIKPRFVLADEVGLGKTIEAGLILHSLLMSNPALRVLVVTPGSMSRQWLCELYLRFGARAFRLLEAEQLMRIRLADRAEWLADKCGDGRLIVSTSAFAADATLPRQLLKFNWDCVIIDEAHRFSAGHTLLPYLRKLSEKASAVLALSATPTKRDVASLAALLGLIAPDAYRPDDVRVIAKQIKGQERLWGTLTDATQYVQGIEQEGGSVGFDDLQFLAKLWRPHAADDPVLSGFVDRLLAGDATAAKGVIGYAQEFHRLDYRIVRTRRASVDRTRLEWPTRRMTTVKYTMSTAERNLLALIDELAARAETIAQRALILVYRRLLLPDPVMAETVLQERSKAPVDQDGCRAAVIDELLQDPEPDRERELLSALVAEAKKFDGESRWLRSAQGVVSTWNQECHSKPPSRFAAALSWIQAYFKAQPENQLLVFAQERPTLAKLREMLASKFGEGSVGVFRQGMSDEELSAAALAFQQGRTRVLISDELGGEGRNFQNAAAVVHFDIPWSVARIEQRIGRLDRVGRATDRDVLSVVLVSEDDFENRLLRIHQQLFRVFEQSIGGLEFGLPQLQGMLNAALLGDAHAIDAVEEKLPSLISDRRSREDEAFEYAMDSSMQQLQEGMELASEVERYQRTHTTPQVILKWAAALGVKVRPQGTVVEFAVYPERLRRELAGGTATRIYRGTFDSRLALRDESLQMFGPGHVFIEQLVYDWSSSTYGRTAACVADLGEAGAGRVFAIIAVRARPFDQTAVSAPIGLRAVRYLAPKTTCVVLELTDDSKMTGAVNDRALLEAIQKATLRRAAPEDLDSAMKLDRLWKAVARAEDVAISKIREHRRPSRETAVRELQREFEVQRQFADWQGDTAQIRQIDESIAGIADESPVVEAIQIIVGSR